MRAGSAGRGCLLILAALICGGAARAEVRPRVVQGDVVFTLRPMAKPPHRASDGDEAAARSTGQPAAPREIQLLVKEVSTRYDMDPGLIASVIGVESGFNQMAVSPKGARGLMQLMPATARQYGVRDVHDPRENVEGGVAYLRDLVRRYNGDMKLALAAYNAGPEAVERASGVPNYRETRDYIDRIERRYGQRLTYAAMKSGGLSPVGPTSIQTKRDESGVLVATNRRATGVTVVQRHRKTRP